MSMDQDLTTSKHRTVSVLLDSQFAFLTGQTGSVQNICVEMGPALRGIERVWTISHLDPWSISIEDEGTMDTTDELIQKGDICTKLFEYWLFWC